MSNITTAVKNDDGYIIIAAILILTLLTLIGISATNTSSLESQISSNAQLHQNAFYAADSGWRVAALFLDAQFPMITTDCGTDTSGGVADVLLSPDKFDPPDVYPVPNTNNISYSVAARFDGAEYAKLWDVDLFMRYKYTLISTGIGPGNMLAPTNSRSRVTVSVGKIGEKGG